MGLQAAAAMGNQDLIGLGQAFAAQAVKHVGVLELPLTHPSARVTKALRLLLVERARVRTRRTRPTGNLTVNATVGSGTGTPCGLR